MVVFVDEDYLMNDLIRFDMYHRYLMVVMVAALVAACDSGHE